MFANGIGTAATFNFPNGVAVDSARNVFVMDTGNTSIRKITPSGVVTTFASLGTSAARGIAIDGSGNLYNGGYSAQIIQKITPAGVVSTLAGLSGVAGAAEGLGSAARFNSPAGLVVDPSGNVFVVDRNNHTIRKITPAGLVSTFAGFAGVSGSTDGNGTSARFNRPWGIARDGAGNLFVSDTNNATIRKITPAGDVTTFAGSAGAIGNLDATGTAARFDGPTGLTVDSLGNLFVGNELTIRKITPAGVVTTLAGDPLLSGSTDGLGSAARFSALFGVAVDSNNNLYATSGNNHLIRRSVFPPKRS